mmetsp:Transcript_112221/g.223020  ORF Transcript_112221/g.223020 Transcript_112221/m.223020 type:complete len:169 (-) Transcript_112221:144-650(-)
MSGARQHFAPLTDDERRHFFDKVLPAVNALTSQTGIWGAELVKEACINHAPDCWIVLERGHFVLRLPGGFPKESMNGLGSVHGGALATLFDNLTTIAASTVDRRSTVSVSLNCTFHAAVKLDAKDLDVECWVFKAGKTLLFTRAELRSSQGLVMATCEHVKCAIQSKL